eukprot:TRINITY_DN835_c0_g1_i2.p2 TRINITY_DN835_c0_g1~~TRINITY_DN835_c0_g1_i2.p2  ORF type:complete len:108 (-),score=29.59 TRINITY_DN835_c0_g1_i2:794-1117(-)
MSEISHVDDSRKIPFLATKENLKSLFACRNCYIVKPKKSFEEDGCENCHWTWEKKFDHTKFITKNFDGLIAMIQPTDSWVAKWQDLATKVPGVYAITVAVEEETEEA